MKKLIINADDLGADEARNAGIFEAIEAGAVTSASLLVNGPALEDALGRMSSLGEKIISFGVHFNLSEGKPLSSGLRLLTGVDGCFRGKAGAHQLLMRQGDPDLEREIASELEAQILAFRKAGVPIRHLDGHQHIHVFPAAIRAVVLAAKTHRIPWMRIPEEPCPQFAEGPDSRALLDEAQGFSKLGGMARGYLRGTAIRTPDHFRGLYLKGKLSPSLLEEILQALPRGLTELMVHPGRVPVLLPSGPFSSFSTPDREKELITLLADGLRTLLAQLGISLTPFPEV